MKPFSSFIKDVRADAIQVFNAETPDAIYTCVQGSHQIIVSRKDDAGQREIQDTRAPSHVLHASEPVYSLEQFKSFIPLGIHALNNQLNVAAASLGEPVPANPFGTPPFGYAVPNNGLSPQPKAELIEQIKEQLDAAKAASVMTSEDLERKLAEKSIELGRQAAPTDVMNYYGGITIGHWEGRVSALERLLSDLEQDDQRPNNNFYL